MSKHELTIKRDEIGNCRRCGSAPEGENFKGRGSEYCTHLESQNGWWLRIDHSYEWFDHSIRLPDKVGELMCPTCLEKYSRDLEELLQL